MNRQRKRRDKYSAFGGISHGTRVVRAGGRVKFDGTRFQSDKLLDFVGSRVRVSATDPWRNETVEVHHYSLHEFICHAARANTDGEE